MCKFQTFSIISINNSIFHIKKENIYTQNIKISTLKEVGENTGSFYRRGQCVSPTFFFQNKNDNDTKHIEKLQAEDRDFLIRTGGHAPAPQDSMNRANKTITEGRI